MIKNTNILGRGSVPATLRHSAPGAGTQPQPPLHHAIAPYPPPWFCVRTKLKQERHAAASLQALPHVEVFCPRIRFQRQTRRGKVWFEEALFPGYLFARFDLEVMFNAVNCVRGVAGLIKFGGTYPSIPVAEIEGLRAWFVGKETKVIVAEPQVGQTSAIVEGPFKGLSAVITKVMPGTQRVAVLLEVLGRQSEVQMQVSDLAATHTKGVPL